MPDRSSGASPREMALRLAMRLAPEHVAPRQRARLRRALDPTWHRDLVGGMWDEIGALQFEFLVEQGLRPGDRFLDVGCGSLRGGLHFIRYLDQGRYCGMDVRASLLKAGEQELARAGLTGKGVTLLEERKFRFARFERKFDIALAQSLFSHLPFNVIMRCLTEIEAALVPGGRFFATFFANPGPRLRIDEMRVADAEKDGWPARVRCDADPYYYDPDIFRWAVEGSSLSCALPRRLGPPRPPADARLHQDRDLRSASDWSGGRPVIRRRRDQSSPRSLDDMLSAHR